MGLLKNIALIHCALISVLVLEAVDANTLRDPYICGQPKCNTIDKLKYSKYISYNYKYGVLINTMFEGSSENKSSLHIEAEITLEFITECEGILKIHSIKMNDQDENYLQEREQNFAEKLSAYNLRFALQNGIITEICPQEQDEDWVLNFKRGVLSLFQNSMSRFDIDFDGLEKDIHGVCKTKYHMQGQQNTSLILLKTKDLTECMDRSKYLSILQSVRYNFQSKFQTWPVLQSESRCRIVIDHNIYTSIQCRERHLFEPFSGKQSGAMTIGFQNLDLINETQQTSDEILEEKNEELEVLKLRYDLIHHHIPTIRASIGLLQSARDILKQLCKVEEVQASESANTDKQETDKIERSAMVAIWGEFIRACRGLSYVEISQLYNRAHTICPEGKKHIVDALPYIASDGSVALIKDMIIKKIVNEETGQEWLMSMAMIPRPHEKMIVSVGELLKNDPTNKFIALASSSMIHSYCRNSGKILSDCCTEIQNKNIVQILENNLYDFHNNFENITKSSIQKIIISIKALGNIGGFTNTFRDLLMTIIDNPSINLMIRINAVEAFRRTPCEEMREYFLQIFREKKIHVEVRIAAYLQVMRCPRYVIIRKILDVLRNEEINQVSSFVWSHLQNLGKSTIPSRVEKQGFLSGNTIPKPKENPDFRKFSRSFEYGVFFDEFNAGGNCEANVIFSPDSYIPRSLSLNLTMDLFGESINILELKTRGEGFEHYIENIFGNNGVLSRSKIDEKLSSIRFARSAENEGNSIKKKIEDIDFKNEGSNRFNPLLDLGIKVFGNEISYWTAEGDDEILNSIKELNPLHHIHKILSGKEIDYQKASLFLDSTFSVPTGSGLPMTMNLLGTNIINLKMSGSISNIDDFFKTKNLDFEGKMHPSMALNIAATMGVNGGGLGGTGIRVNFRMHTTTALSAKLKLRSAKLASLQISLPHSKQEIFEAKSELIILHGNKEFKQLGFNKNQIEAHTCTWSIIDKAIGVKLCASYEFPNMTNMEDAPYFIMAGPAYYLLSLEKVDPTASVYSFLYTWNTNDTTDVIRFLFDTPGSMSKRSFDSSITYSKEYGSAIMTFQSAESFLKAQATYKNSPTLKLLECTLDVNGQKHFDAVMSVNRREAKNGYILIPKIYLAVNNERITELAGTLTFAQKKGVTQCDVSLEFQTKKLASRLIGYITWNGPSKGTKLRLDYQFLGERTETIRIEVLLSNREIGIRKDVYGELGLQFTSYPHLNFFTDVKYMSTPNHVDLKFNLSSARELKGENGTLQYSYYKHRTFDGYKLKNHLKINKPYLDLMFQYEENGDLTLVSAEADYDKTKKTDSMVGLWGKLYIPPGTRLYLEAGLNITLPRFVPFTLKTNIFEKKPNEIDITAECVWFTGTDVSLVALYQDQSTTRISSHRIKTVLTSTTFEQVLIEAKYSQDNKQLSVNAKGEQGIDQYGVMVRYVTYSEKNFSCYGQLEIKSKIYSANIIADLKNNTSILGDIHIDQLRDVHFTYTKINSLHLKKLYADVNWDANRNPNQKLSVGLELLNKGSLNYEGSFNLFYPDRLVYGKFEFLVKDWLCMWLVNLGWSPDDNILWKVKAYSEIEKETVYALLSEMDTPFQGWRNTSLNIMWRFFDNLQEFNTNMTWEDERILISLLSDYYLKTNEVYGEFRGLINSTLTALPNAAAVARHKHHWRKSSDTLLSFEILKSLYGNQNFQFNNEGMIMINSSWKFDKDATHSNITGRVALKSPFPGYKTGLFATKFVFNQRRDIHGLTNLNLEDDRFIIVVEGHTHRFTNNMLNISITSPSSVNHQIMVARFGIIDTDRHIVALIETPKLTVGTEIIFKLESTQAFHIYGFLAIPVEFLQNVKLLAKRNTNEVDFRLGFENMEFGFTGIWRYISKLNFEYLYKLYTPLKGFEENGLVFKNIYDVQEGALDSEISIKLSKHKLGLTIFVKNNEKGLLKVIEEMRLGTRKKNLDSLLDDFSTDILIILDTIYYDTIKFNSNIKKVEGENEEEIITINANLLLSNSSTFILKNELTIEDLGTMMNNFQLSTPYRKFSQIDCIYTVEFNIGQKYNITGLLLIKYNGVFEENSMKILYEHEEDDEYENYIALIQMSTQVESLKSIDAKIDIYIDGSVSKLNANIYIPSCNMSTNGQVEIDESFMNMFGAINLTSPYFQPYKVRVNFKKDFTEIENQLITGVQIQQGNQNNYFAMESAWHANRTDHFKFKARCSLIPVIPPSDLFVEYGKAPTDKTKILRVEAHIGSREALYMLNAEQSSKLATINLISPHRGFRNVNFTGELQNNQIISGVFYGDTITYKIQGKIINQSPLKMVVTLQPYGDGESYTIHLQTSEDSEYYNLTASVISKVQFIVHINYQFGKNHREFLAKIDSSHPSVENIFLKSRMHLLPDGQISINTQAATPFKRLKTLNIDTDIILTGKTGSFVCIYNMTNLNGNGNLKWSFLANDLYLKALSRHLANGNSNSLVLDSYYHQPENPEPSDIGFYINIDDSWKIGANTTFDVEAQKKATVKLNILLPKPNLDVHTFEANLDINENSTGKSAYVKYVTDVSLYTLLASGKIKNLDGNFSVNVTTVDGLSTYQRIIENLLDTKYNKNWYDVNYVLTSPLYKDEETFKFKGSYDGDDKDFTILKGTINYPASKEITKWDLAYGGMKHTFGTFNCTTPLENITWLSTDIKILNKEKIAENIIKLMWPNNYAMLNSTQKMQKKNGMNIQNGNVQLDIPLNTRHLLSGDYEYQSGTSSSEGNIKMFHNMKQFVDGTYKKVEDRSENNLKRDTIDVNIKNDYTPIGVNYIHQYDGEVGNVDIKQVSIYNLTDSHTFNITGRVDIELWKAGKQVKLLAIHGDRNVKFQNNYESKEKELYQKSKIELSPDVWFEYDVLIQNKTNESVESQELNLNIKYPKRKLGLTTFYHLRETLLEGTAILNWSLSNDDKTVKIFGKWDNPESVNINQHDIEIILTHPEFNKDVTLVGNYVTDTSTTSNISAVLEYSDFENERLTFNSMIQDNSNGPIRDYKFIVDCEHPATNLELKINSNLNLKNRLYYLNNFYKYKKSLFNEIIRQGKLFLDVKKQYIEFEQTRDEDWYDFNATWKGNYPEYNMNFNMNRTNGYDTGICVISGKNKNIIAHFNRTNEISYHLIGQINDPRSADLIAWRDFENDKTIDISSYIQLNHSRLLTSKIQWRPEMYQQIKSSLVQSLRVFYYQTNEILTLIKVLPMEAHEAMKNVWSDARPRVKDLLNDLNDLHVIKNDMDDLQEFINESYDANEFYIKDIIETVLKVLNELTIKNHMEGLPEIFNEMWQVMGDTGTSLRNSILWIIDTMKTSYAQLVEKMSKLLEADLMDQVSELIEAGILRYDAFIKNLHHSFITYFETVMSNAGTKLKVFWTNVLKAVEPAYLQLAHYVESFVYKFGTEILDFFYARTNELTETPFYTMLAEFSQDIDKIAKDFRNNDAITNIKKYTNILFKFFNEKILIHIPFQKELKDIVKEIMDELNKLQELSLVKSTKMKFWEAKSRLQWWYDYFKIGDALKNIAMTMYQKLTEIPRTAIQNEEKHRVAKTNFIFDPRKGIVLLEQKLPMPWHAFNRTPDFSEIAEYKVARDLIDTWVFSNTSFMSYYYLYKQYTNVYNLIPPFSGNAVITGYGTIVTFDGRVYTVNEPGTYLLLSDFLLKNVSILIKSLPQNKYKIILVTKSTLIHVDLFDETIIIGQQKLSILPNQVDGWIINRNDEYITLKNIDGIKLKCDCYYKTCSINVEGWYFARLGGLFGTMNNEPFDDIMTPDRKITSTKEFLDSWKIENDYSKVASNENLAENNTECEIYFKTKVSSLKACFSIVDPDPFYVECLNAKNPCIVANAYMEVCSFKYIPIRLPNKCMECKSSDGKILEEGTFSEIFDIPNATDVVFLVEAHECNKNIRKERNTDMLISTLESKLRENGFVNNRYTVVGFGGNNIYKTAHPLYINGKSFVSSREIKDFFNYIQIDSVKGNNSYKADTFDAFKVASNLNFRPGVSKTFILFPCTRCDISYMKLDYSVIHQVLMDSSISLHIIMDDEFKFNKKRIAKNLYGIDGTYAYTAKDLKVLVGDAKLREQIRLPKTKLGFCASLAIETNGTVFSGNKMRSSEPSEGRRAAIVLGARAAQSSRPCSRARCECEKARLKCSVCPRYLTRNPIDDISLSMMDSSEIDDFIDNFLDMPTDII